MHDLQEHFKLIFLCYRNVVFFFSNKVTYISYLSPSNHHLLNFLLVVMAISFHIIIPSFCIILSIFSISLLPLSLSQPAVCNGVLVTYRYETGSEISPVLYPADPTHQPYRFVSTLTVRNNGANELENWRVFVGFQHNEILVSANGAVLADGTALPANVGNGTILSGSSVTDLKSAIQTAGDITQMEVQIDLVGTQFGVRAPDVPMLHNISLANDGYSCLNPSTQGFNLINTILFL